MEDTKTQIIEMINLIEDETILNYLYKISKSALCDQEQRSQRD